MANPKDELKKLRGKQSELLGKKKDFLVDIESVESEISKLESLAAKARKQIAMDEAKALVGNLELLAKEFRQGSVFTLWEKIVENLSVLRDNDVLFFNNVEARLKDIPGLSEEEVLFYCKLFGNCLHKSDKLPNFLAWVGGDRRKDGNIFFGGDE